MNLLSTPAVCPSLPRPIAGRGVMVAFPSTMTPLLSIDPGIGGTGWAYWTGSSVFPQKVGCVRPRKASGPWEGRFREVILAMRKAVPPIHLAGGEVVIEEPEYQSSARGIAALKNGNLVRLCLIAGGLIALYPRSTLRLVTPSVWKGSLPKDVVAREIRKFLGPRRVRLLRLNKHPDHTWDAVGIGLWAIETRTAAE